MECSKIKRVLPVLLLVVAAAMLSAGCSDDEDPTVILPEALVGDWAEVGYDRRMVLQANGDFFYITPTVAAHKGQEGSGTWEATADDLTLHLSSGRFRWQDSVNNAPISFTFDYEATADTLTLTFEIIDEVVIAHYGRLD